MESNQPHLIVDADKKRKSIRLVSCECYEGHVRMIFVAGVFDAMKAHHLSLTLELATLLPDVVCNQALKGRDIVGVYEQPVIDQLLSLIIGVACDKVSAFVLTVVAPYQCRTEEIFKKTSVHPSPSNVPALA